MDKAKQTRILIAVLPVVTFIAIVITVWALFFRDTKKPVNQDYAPQQIEQNAEPVEEGNTSKLDSPEGGSAVSLTYSNQVTLSLSSGEAMLLFQNPAKSNQDMVLQLHIDGKMIAQSGRLPAGYKLSKLSNVDTDKLSTGTYEGKFTVLYYNTDSGEKAIVNTEIPVTITVK